MTAIDSPNCAWRSGAPSRLGLAGGTPFLAVEIGAPWGFAAGDDSAEVITGLAGAWDVFEGEFCSSDRGFLNF